MKVLLDTSFLINLLAEEHEFHQRAIDYFAHFVHDKAELKVSTIAISEYAIKDDVSNLPLRNLQILPFNFLHAKQSGILGNASMQCRKDSADPSYSRAMVLSDSKMFAQAEVEHIDWIVSADHKAMRLHEQLFSAGIVHFKYIDITQVDCSLFFSELNFE